MHIKVGNSLIPGYFNSDLIENLLCQQRGIINGLNTNPILAQYGPSQNAIILGQKINSSNSGASTALFTANKPCRLNPNTKKICEERYTIKIM
jgi:hypothetical protein